jgi:hypothetical protein
MHDPVGVRMADGLKQLRHDAHDFRQRVAFVLVEDILELATLDVLHGDEGGAVVFTIFINGNDAGVVEAAGGLGLALEARENSSASAPSS